MRYCELFSRSLKRCPNVALEIQILIEEAFGLSRTQFWVKKNEFISDLNALRRFRRLLKRFEAGEPTAYILKKQHFYGESFYVDKRVLIPRPETELLVEAAVNCVSATDRVLDIGSGSGVIAIMIAKLTGARVIGLDKSPPALAVFKKNIAAHGMDALVSPLHGDLFPDIPSATYAGPFNLVVSNPPYIPEREWRELDPRVRDFEPKTALTAGNDGYEALQKIIAGAGRFLVPGGRLLMEMGYDQSEKVVSLLEDSGYHDIGVIEDYSRIPRIAGAVWSG